MIIESPIDLELTQISGQNSQPPWKNIDGSYSDLVCIDGEPSIFNVKQSDENIDFTYTGNISDKAAIENVKKIYDLDFDLAKFYKYLDISKAVLKGKLGNNLIRRIGKLDGKACECVRRESRKS